MDFLPIFLDIRDRAVLVDGGGTAAARRVERASGAGAAVVAFDPEPGDDLRDVCARRGVTFHRRLPTADDVAGCAVVYGASEDAVRDDHLYQWSRQHFALCNIADVPEKCDFITPSIVDRSPIVIAISTAGMAPVMARILRARIEATLPARFGRLAEFTGQFRKKITQAITDGRERRHFWERMIDGPAGDFFLSGNDTRANKQINSDLEAHASDKLAPTGEVYLVGAGPGDPDLLTFKALRLMQRADVVLYDRLIGDEILSLVRRDAERIYVGKLPCEHTMEQTDISALMVRLAKQGNRVLRLKGGDPFIFGRGGEEIETLSENGIGFQVVPGITAASGCSTYAGIPLTHRGHAQSCTFVTAHGKDGVLDLDWDVLTRKGQTVAIYMGLSNLPALAEGFRARAADLSTPVAVVQNGTRSDQKTVVGTLGNIAEKAQVAELKSPAMIIVGTVVSLREKLNWTNDTQAGHQMGLASDRTLEI